MTHWKDLVRQLVEALEVLTEEPGAAFDRWSDGDKDRLRTHLIEASAALARPDPVALLIDAARAVVESEYSRPISYATTDMYDRKGKPLGAPLAGVSMHALLGLRDVLHAHGAALEVK